MFTYLNIVTLLGFPARYRKSNQELSPNALPTELPEPTEKKGKREKEEKRKREREVHWTLPLVRCGVV